MNEGNAEVRFRYRVNASSTTKGAVTFDCTVEGYGHTQEEVLAEHDKFFAAVKARHPLPIP